MQYHIIEKGHQFMPRNKMPSSQHPFNLIPRCSKFIWRIHFSRVLHTIMAIISKSALLIILLIIISPAVCTMANAVRKILAQCYPQLLSKGSFVSYASFYIIMYGLAATAYSILCYYAWYTRRPKRRDAEYLRHSLESGNGRLPLVTTENRNVVLIQDNIRPIKNFLQNNNNSGNILTIDAPWGTGKTTTILLAIESEQKDNSTIRHRYIYESAFKYKQYWRI